MPFQNVLSVVLKDVAVCDLLNEPGAYSGWLRKRGKRHNIPGYKKLFAWARKYIVLHDGCMYSFENERSKKENGGYSLCGYRSVEVADREVPENEAIYTFKVVHKYPEEKTFYLSAASEHHRHEWMLKIREQIMLANGREVVVDDSFKPKKLSNNRVSNVADGGFQDDEDMYIDDDTPISSGKDHWAASSAQHVDTDDEAEDSGNEFYEDHNFIFEKKKAALPDTRAKMQTSRPPPQPPSMSGDKDDDVYISDDDINVMPRSPVQQLKAPPRQPVSAPVNRVIDDEQEDYIYSGEMSLSPPQISTSKLPPKKIPPVPGKYKGHEDNVANSPSRFSSVPGKSSSLPRAEPLKAPPRQPVSAPENRVNDDDQEDYIYSDETLLSPPQIAASKPPPKKIPPVPGTYKGHEDNNADSPSKFSSVAGKSSNLAMGIPHEAIVCNDDELYQNNYVNTAPSVPPARKNGTLPKTLTPKEENCTPTLLHKGIQLPGMQKASYAVAKKGNNQNTTAFPSSPRPVPRLSKDDGPSNTSDVSATFTPYKNREDNDEPSEQSGEGLPVPKEAAPPVPASPATQRDKQWKLEHVDQAMCLSDSDVATQKIAEIAEDGVYFIRDGTSGWVLVVYAQKTRSYKISNKDRMYGIATNLFFNSITDLISYYSEHRLPCGVRLITPFRKHPACSYL